MISCDGNRILIATPILNAEILNGVIVSLSEPGGREFISSDASGDGISLLYRHGETVPIKNTRKGSVETYRISDTMAEIRFDAWDGNALITVSEDKITGELLIEPEVTSARAGILAARYTIDGISDDLRLVAPIYQGIDMELSDELIRGRKWSWPHNWEAGLAILRDAENQCGFWVHCEDHSYRTKSLVTGIGKNLRSLAFDTEAYGPIERNMSAGGIVWRIGTYRGDWKVPAGIYRDWLWKTYALEKEAARRAPWMNDIRLGISWCPTDAKILEELAKKVDPKTVLLHLPRWRNFKYDTHYPDFTPSDEFVEFLKYASSKGFHCMPHCNSVDMDPEMPEYRYVQDFKYRDIEGGRLLGWGWENGRGLGVPSSNKALDESREQLVMIKVHPGLAMWRSILAQRIGEALEKLGNRTDTVFIDVTLCTFNLDNCLVDNTTSIEGMKLLIEHIESIGNGLAVGGEGLNEITMQNLTFAQAHLFDSHHSSRDGLERCGGCDINAFMFGRLCRTIGYSDLGGGNENQVLRERIHEEHGAIPTITVGSADEISSPNAEFSRIFKLAGE